VSRHLGVLVDGLVLPESPRWYSNRLWFLDQFGKKVYSADLKGNADVVFESEDQPSGLGFTPDGGLLVVLKNERVVCRIAKGLAEPYADLTSLGGDHLNDMVVDSFGRAYVDLRADPPMISGGSELLHHGHDAIVLVDQEGACSIAASGLTTPNGIAIDPRLGRLVVGETRANRLTAYSVDPSTGALSSRELFADLGDARPDGICSDAEGAVWVASPNLGEFRRVHPGGRVSDAISVRPKFAIACGLAGSDRRTLVMTTASTTWDRMAKHDAQGFVEIGYVDVPGVGIP
jgi:sugar lactone lactonase YvrE